MQILTKPFKLAFHRQLVAHPTIHGWALNLYLAGEEYPQMVNDYFPSQFCPDQELAQKLSDHAKDEEKHGLIFRHLLKKINQPILPIQGSDIFNNVVKEKTKVDFLIHDNDNPDNRLEKIAHFLAHAHFLESRVEQSLKYHLEVCDQMNKTEVVKALTPILEDESKHSYYTYQRVFDLVSKKKAQEILAFHQAAEKKANLEFSTLQVMQITKLHHQLIPQYQKYLLEFCGFVMNMAKLTTH